MICIKDEIYGDNGTGVKALPEGYVSVGQIEEKVSNVQPMIKRSYVSNTLNVGDVYKRQAQGFMSNQRNVYNVHNA